MWAKDIPIQLPNHNERNQISGTELIIRDLRQVWARSDFDELYKQLSMLISPFDADIDFNIRLKTSEEEHLEDIQVSDLSEYFEVKLDGVFDPKNNILNYDLWERVPTSKERDNFPNNQIPLDQLIQKTDYDVSLDGSKLGPIRVVLLFYPRTKATILGSGFKLSELSAFLKRNVGIKLYRDSIRVKPYGEMDQPGGDWLNLGARFAQNPASRKRSDHRIRPSQLVGALFISRDDNTNLSDSSSREGLIQDDEFRLLYEFVRGCIRIVEASSHKIFVREDELTASETDGIDRDLETVNKKLGNIRDDLQDISDSLSKHEDEEIKVIGETVSALVSRISYATESIELLESQTRLYRGLATIGIASAVFGHETQIQIGRMVSAVNQAKDYLLLSQPDLPKSISKLEIAVTASEKVMAWGGFALDRIRRDKRERRKDNVSSIILRIIKELLDAFEAIDALLDKTEIDETIESRIFKIDIESIILNLLTNAYTACRQVKSNRKVKVVMQEVEVNGQKGYSLIVSDSGPGVNEKLRDIIWEPTFTTKTTKNGATEEGTGMGLAIVDSIVEEMKGVRKVDDDPILGGAKFEVWLPIIN